MNAFDPFAFDNDDEPSHEKKDFFAQTSSSTKRQTGHDSSEEGDGESSSHDYVGHVDEGTDHDVFGQPLTDVDLWDEQEDENPFARPEVQDNLGFLGTSDGRKDSFQTPSRKLSSTSSKRSKSREDEAGSRRRHHSKPSSSSKRSPNRATPNDKVGILVPELTSFTPKKEDSLSTPRQAHGQSNASSGPRQEKNAAGDDRIGELLDLLHRENMEKTKEGSSSRTNRSSRGNTSERSGASLRQKLMRDSSEPSSPSRRQGESSTGRKSSSKRDVARSSHDSIQSWDEHGSFDNRRHSTSRSGSRRSGPKSTKNRGDEGGLDFFIKGDPSRSSRGDTEHRSVVSAPAATTATDELSKLCQKMNVNF